MHVLLALSYPGEADKFRGIVFHRLALLSRDTRASPHTAPGNDLLRFLPADKE